MEGRLHYRREIGRLLPRLLVVAVVALSALWLVAPASAAPTYVSGAYVGGNPTVGNTLAVQPGTWNYSGSISFAYTWTIGGVTVGTAQMYTSQPADVGKQATVTVTATDSTGSTSANVGSSGVIRWPNPVNTTRPTIKGDLVPGGTITADLGVWQLPDPHQPGPLTITFAWWYDGIAQADAKKPTIVLPDTAAGKEIQLYVNASSPSGDSYPTSMGAYVTGKIGTAPPPPPPPPVTSTTNISSGQTLKGNVHWTVQASGKAHATNFYANNVLLKVVVADGDNWAYDLDTTQLSDGANQIGYDIYNQAGQRVYTGHSIPVTIKNAAAPPPTIEQNITAGQTLKGTVSWTATPSTPVTKIVFEIDGNKVSHTDTAAPYTYTVDTTTLTNGAHQFGLTVTLPDGSVVSQPYQIGTVTIDNPTSGGGGSSGGSTGGGSTTPTPQTPPAAQQLPPSTPPAPTRLPTPKPQPNKPLKLLSGGFALTAKTATAGNTFGAAMFVVRSDTGKRITGAPVKAKATINGKPLALTWKGWYRGAAGATWRIPTTAKGKTLVGSLTITWHGTTMTKKFTARIR